MSSSVGMMTFPVYGKSSSCSIPPTRIISSGFKINHLLIIVVYEVLIVISMKFHYLLQHQENDDDDDDDDDEGGGWRE